MSGNLKMLLMTLLLVAATCDAQENAGIHARITRTGIEFVKDVAFGWASDWINDYEFPDFVDDFKVKDLNMQSFSPGTVGITTAAPDVINMSLNGANLLMTGNAEVKVWFFTLHFGFSIQVENFDGTFGFRLGADASGKATIAFINDSCQTTIGLVRFQITDTSYDTAFNLVLGAFETSITEWVAEQTCPTMQVVMEQQGSKLMDLIPTSFKLPLVPISLDISLVEPPEVDPRSITLSVKGKAFPTDNPMMTFPFTAPPLEKSYGWLKGFYVVLGDFSVNTFLYSLWYIGWLEGSAATAAELPITLPFTMTPEGLSALVPGLTDYPDSSLRFAWEVPEAPTVEFTPSHMNITASLLVNGNVTGGDLGDETKNAFVMRLDLWVTGSAKVSEGNITGDISEVDFYVSQVGSNTIEVDKINAVLQAILPQAIPQLNDILRIGMEIPTIAGFSTSDESILLKQDALEVAANLYHETYSPAV